VAVPDPAPQAPVLATAPPAPLPPVAAPVAEAAPPAPPAPPVTVAKAEPSAFAPAPVVVLPSSDAEYLQNEKPAYPSLSRKKHEQGKVVVGVLIGPDGSAQKAHIHESSGFERLDQAALATAQRWRYVPGKKGGVATAMWFNVPINFVLE
jgi:protein TonB